MKGLEMSYWVGYFLVLIIGFAIFIGLFVVIRKKFNGPKKTQSLLENIMLIFLTVAKR